MAWDVEYTDTFGGEANYSWVRRATIGFRKGESKYGLMRRAKAAVGLAGVRGRVDHQGDRVEFRPFKHCTVMFVIWNDWTDEAAELDKHEADWKPWRKAEAPAT